MKRILLAVLLSLIGTLAFAQTPPGGYGPTVGGSGGGITQVSSLPATCTPGSVVNLTTPPGGVFICNSFPSPANTWSRDSSSLNVVDAQVSGVLADGQARFDALFTNGSAIVTCADCHFLTTAKQGQIVWGNSCQGAVNGCGGASHNTSVTVLPQGTIASIDSDTQIHSTATANASAAGTATQLIIWGDDDTTALANAVTAATGTPGACKTLQLSVGLMLVQSGIGNSAYTCQLNITGGPTESFQVAGYGQVNTVLVPTPNFNFATCTGLSSSCFFGVGGTQYFNFGIWGAENSSCGGGQSGKSAMVWGTDNRFLNVEIAGWCAAQASGFAGITTNGTFGSAPGASFLTLDGAGSKSLVVGASFFPLSYSFVGNCGDVCVTITGGAFESTGNVYGPVPATSTCGGAGFPCIINNSAGILQSTNDALYSLTNVNQMAGIRSVGTTYLTNDSLYAGGGVNTKAFNVLGGTLHASLSEFGGSTTDIALSSGTYDDLGGNKLVTSGKVFMNTGAVTLTGVGSLRGSCSGVATASSTLGFYGLGEHTALTCTSTTVSLGPVMSKSGTVYALNVTAGTGGVNASSGVVTVLKNGGATTMTCTLGTGTSCIDTTHTFTYVNGDVISAQFTTQVADTLANVKVQLYAP